MFIESALTLVTTGNAGNGGNGGNENSGSNGALELDPEKIFWPGFGVEKMSLKITIFKSRLGRDSNDLFSNVYLLQTAALFNSAEALAAVHKLENAERIIMPTSVEFMRATVSEVDENGAQVESKTRGIGLLTAGTFELPEGSKPAGSHDVYAIEKVSSIGGRAGISTYRYCLTSDEVSTWRKTKVLPERFTANIIVDAAAAISFRAALLAVNTASLKLMLPDLIDKDGNHTQRVVTAINDAGIRSNQPTRKKQGVNSMLLKAAQAKVNALGRSAVQAKKGDVNGGLPDETDLLLIKLKQEAFKVRDALPVELQGRLKMPEIFNNVVLP